MRIASIDIGTNTILMLVGDADGSGMFRVVRDEHAIARMGKGVDAARRITEDALERVLDVMRRYREISTDERCDRVLACGTSALRDASNRDAVIARILAETGISVRLLSGDEEALMTYRGTMSGFAQAKDGLTGVLDIGGGSTEIVAGKNGQVEWKQSIDIGAVRLKERCLRSDPPSTAELEDAAGTIQHMLNNLPDVADDISWIGVAGTLTTIAAWDLQLAAFDRERVDGYQLSLERISAFIRTMRELPLSDILRIPQILPARADIILAGALILEAFLTKMNHDSIVVSTRGLRYGLLLDAVNDRFGL